MQQFMQPPRRRALAVRGIAAAALALSLTSGLAPSALAHTASPATMPASPVMASPTFSAGYLDGVTGENPSRTVNLAGTWQFTPLMETICQGGGRFGTTTGPFVSCTNTDLPGTATTIKVPGGGWLKQGFTNVSKATYARDIKVPAVTSDQVTVLRFGAINHRATLSVDGVVVGTQVTSYTDSEFDLSKYVTPGHTHHVEVTVEGRKALIGDDMRYTVPEGASWSDDVAQGIFRSAQLEVFPAVRVSDTAVRTSVAKRTVEYDVYVTNSSAAARTITLSGRIGSANHKGWAYPRIPSKKVTVPANTTSKVIVGPLKWKAGTGSYWLPNVPYRAGYKAQLHNLRVKLTPSTSGHSDHWVNDRKSSYDARFGFRDFKQVGDHYELNGVPVNLLGDSLQGANYDNIDFHGISDAYDTLPGFLKPSSSNPGWPQAVRNYQRLNYNVVRIHQIPATPYMLDTADELGLMIIDETAIRGSNNRENFITGHDNMIKHLTDLIVRDRNHASIIRWSQANEPLVVFFSNPGAGPAFDEELYQTVMAHDTSRPISTDGDSADLASHDNYTVFCHYHGFSFGKYDESICDGPSGKPQGQGEFIWSNDDSIEGMTWFATSTMRMREKGADDTRPYTLLSAWASVIPGVNRADMKLEAGYPNGEHPVFGEDNLPKPWSNPTIKLLQLGFNPSAAIDSAFWDLNKLSDTQGTWPVAAAPVEAGSGTRTVTVFNDTFSGDKITLTWRLRAGSPTGQVVDDGVITTKVGLGRSKKLPVAIDVPDTTEPLYLELKVSKPGKGTIFTDASTKLQVTAR